MFQTNIATGSLYRTKSTRIHQEHRLSTIVYKYQFQWRVISYNVNPRKIMSNKADLIFLLLYRICWY